METIGLILRCLKRKNVLNVLNCVLEGEKQVNEISSELAITSIQTSQALRFLKSLNFVDSTRDGRYIEYAATDLWRKFNENIDRLEDLFEDADEEFLERLRENTV